jgi:eukaryotic-like serine/threonine-protein kinase
VPGPAWIGRYRVSRLLGSGGFASVWLGTDDALGEPVAIKVLAENWAHEPDVHQRFVQEARLLRQADSDRVVRMYDIGQLPDGRPYFVMSYADRGTVADRLTGPLPVSDALSVAVETARAVAVLHRLSVVHRDIKPSNVLIRSTVDGGERFLIGDLGVAKQFAHASGLTIAAGTPGYMAPEQAEHRPDIDARADVYGLGAFTYHLLTGTKYTGNQGDVGKLALPAKLKHVVACALAPDREQRWPDAEAYAAALTNALADAPTAGRAVARPPAGARRRRRTTALVLAGIVAGGVLAIVAAVLGAFTPGGGEEASSTPPPRQKTWPAVVTNTFSKSKNVYLGTYSYRDPFHPDHAGKGYGEGDRVQIECQERHGRKVSDPSSGTSSSVWYRTTDGVYISDLYANLTPPHGVPACASR